MASMTWRVVAMASRAGAAGFATDPPDPSCFVQPTSASTTARPRGQCLGGMPLQVLGQARLCTAHQSDPVHGRDRVGRCNTAAELAPRQAGRCQWVAQHLRALEPMLGLWRVCGHGQAMQRQQAQQPGRIGRGHVGGHTDCGGALFAHGRPIALRCAAKCLQLFLPVRMVRPRCAWRCCMQGGTFDGGFGR